MNNLISKKNNLNPQVKPERTISIKNSIKVNKSGAKEHRTCPNIAIILAGGEGKRISNGKNFVPKQFLNINGKPILIRTLEIYEQHSKIDKIYIAVHPDFLEYVKNLVEIFELVKVSGIVAGGSSGQESIYNALIYVEKENPDNSIVLIHDSVRPNVTAEVINGNIDCVEQNGNAITYTNCSETIFVSENGISTNYTPAREQMFRAQAPQSFRLSDIFRAHELIRKTNPNYENLVDSCSLFNALGIETFLVKSNDNNLKVTNTADFFTLKSLIENKYEIENFVESFQQEFAPLALPTLPKKYWHFVKNMPKDDLDKNTEGKGGKCNSKGKSKTTSGKSKTKKANRKITSKKIKAKKAKRKTSAKIKADTTLPKDSAADNPKTGKIKGNG